VKPRIIRTEYEHGAVVFFDLEENLKLALYARKDLAHESKVSLDPHNATECRRKCRLLSGS
jgi:uncharacterized protein